MEYGTTGAYDSVYEYGVQRTTMYQNGQVYSYEYDGRGSVSELVNAIGETQIKYSYGAYGETVSTVIGWNNPVANPYRYNAERIDDVAGVPAFQYLRARYLNPYTATFLTQDTYLGNLIIPLSQNRYTYVHNNPVNFTDPSGHWITGGNSRTISEYSMEWDRHSENNDSYESSENGSFIGNVSKNAIDEAVLDACKDFDFFTSMQAQFGFDPMTSSLMYLVKHGLDIKYEDNSDHYFTILMGGFIYTGFKWDVIAGQVPSGNKELILQLGLSEDEYNYLQYMVRIQNQISSSPSTLALENFLETDNYSTYKKNYEDALGEELTDEEFYANWSTLYNRMSGKADFAHQQITTASTINDTWLFDMSYNGMAADLAGWLGDAILKANNGYPSFGPDDYMADLDADNIVHIMNTKDLSYRDAYLQYYEELQEGTSRATLFLEHTPLQFVEEKIFKSTFGFLDAISRSKNWDDVSEKAPAAHNFYLNLLEGNHEMEELFNGKE